MIRLARARREVERFFRTPKGLLILLLSALLVVAAVGEDLRRVWQVLAASTVTAALVDVPLLRWWKGRWEFPSGAVLTGLLIGMVMSPQEPWSVGAAAAAVAVVAKYVARTRSANVFNPAALALVGAYYVFKAGHS
jgi:Na+-translocating ferredoxin:NAD+ oxidoreductase RnfD subunit